MSGFVLNPGAVGDPHATPRVQLFGATQRRRARHPYTADPDTPANHRGDVPCVCGAAKDNDLHDLPPVDPAITEAEAARLGETEQENP